MKLSQKAPEQGSALMLVPAGFLILVMLGAICVDSAVAYTAQRELQNQAAAAANDAATVAVSEAQLQQGQNAHVDVAVARQVGVDRLSRANVARLTVDSVAVDIEDRAVAGGTVQVVVVTAEGEVPYIFASAMPGVRHSEHVRASASAELRFRQL